MREMDGGRRWVMREVDGGRRQLVRVVMVDGTRL